MLYDHQCAVYSCKIIENIWKIKTDKKSFSRQKRKGTYLWGNDATAVNGKGMEESCDLVTWSLHAVESEVRIGRDLLQGSLTSPWLLQGSLKQLLL